MVTVAKETMRIPFNQTSVRIRPPERKSALDVKGTRAYFVEPRERNAGLVLCGSALFTRIP